MQNNYCHNKSTKRGLYLCWTPFTLLPLNKTWAPFRSNLTSNQISVVNNLTLPIKIEAISYSLTACYPLFHSRWYNPLICRLVALCSEGWKMPRYIATILEYLLSLFFLISAFHSSIPCSLAFWSYTAHFMAIPPRVNGWDHMGLRWFRIANPAESVISSWRHQFGVWNRGTQETLIALEIPYKSKRVWGIGSRSRWIKRRIP